MTIEILSLILKILVMIAVSYLLGAIPTGFIIGKLTKKIDIREFGSGNVGAANAFRVLGIIPGIMTLIIDIAKGLICASIIATYFHRGCSDQFYNLFQIIAGTSSIIGHNWTIFLDFKGGKGVATSAGVFLAIAPIPILLCVAVWGICALITRYISLSSMIAAISLPIFIVIFNFRIGNLVFGIIAAVFVVIRHKGNIERLLHGTENKIGKKVKNLHKT